MKYCGQVWYMAYQLETSLSQVSIYNQTSWRKYIFIDTSYLLSQTLEFKDIQVTQVKKESIFIQSETYTQTIKYTIGLKVRWNGLKAEMLSSYGKQSGGENGKASNLWYKLWDIVMLLIVSWMLYSNLRTSCWCLWCNLSSPESGFVVWSCQ